MLSQQTRLAIVVFLLSIGSANLPNANTAYAASTEDSVRSSAAHAVERLHQGTAKWYRLCVRPLRCTLIPSDKYQPRRTVHKPIFVIHETTMPGLRTEKTAVSRGYRASFHALVLRDGTIIAMVPAAMTAYTAGHSQFKGESDIADTGRRTVNHFAYQVEMESPPDGYWCAQSFGEVETQRGCRDGGGRGIRHSGYTDEQYISLAWLLVKTGIVPIRVTTHAQVDLSGTRSDPRSFDWDKFWAYYEAIPERDKEIFLGNE